MYFDFGCDGSGHKTILMKSGNIGGRFPVTQESLKLKNIDRGIERSDLHVVLEGIDIFNFSLREVPKTIKLLIEKLILTSMILMHLFFTRLTLL